MNPSQRATIHAMRDTFYKHQTLTTWLETGLLNSIPAVLEACQTLNDAFYRHLLLNVGFTKYRGTRKDVEDAARMLKDDFYKSSFLARHMARAVAGDEDARGRSGSGSGSGDDDGGSPEEEIIRLKAALDNIGQENEVLRQTLKECEISIAQGRVMIMADFLYLVVDRNTLCIIGEYLNQSFVDTRRHHHHQQRQQHHTNFFSAEGDDGGIIITKRKAAALSTLDDAIEPGAAAAAAGAGAPLLPEIIVDSPKRQRQV
jgi:hypothetical protein